MGYSGGGGGGGGSGGSGGGTGSSGGSGYRRVGDDRTANIKVDNITSRDGKRGTDVDGIVEVNTTSHFIPPSGTTAERGSRGRAVFGGGVDPSAVLNTMQYVTVATAGDATDFGDMSYTVHSMSACASSTRGLFASGQRNSPLNLGDNAINYITIQSTGNAFDFGDLTIQTATGFGLSNNTRGIFGGGYFLPAPTIYTTIDYVTLASLGNATVFGDISSPTQGNGIRGAASSTRGILGGGGNPTIVNTIEYITIATTGDAQDFGDLTVARRKHASMSNSTRALFGGGENPGNSDVIDYVTIASLGDAIDFGNLTIARDNLAGASTQARGIFAGGDPATDRIDFVTISSVGDATDFGNLIAATDRFTGLSDSHGGLG